MNNLIIEDVERALNRLGRRWPASPSGARPSFAEARRRLRDFRQRYPRW